MTKCSNLDYRWVQGSRDFADAFSIRKDVFIVEQNVPEDIEIDEFDSIALHLTLYDTGKPIASGRIFQKVDSCVIGRICVLKDYRGLSVGNQLMQHLLEKASELGAKRLELDSQVYAIAFYKKFGFREHGSIFLDAGIEHIKMIKEIN